ncbi:biotin synthase [Jannaschia pagri]|uniref:Biotin synthase n=1 Tax=Jannaschia pagri TaxID=2829797 RepID=A0ABQ4NRI8_9RHOB|nr:MULTISPECIES: biotin synthase BioB [unclassified Jannaschia]GIT93207.1 biotin synthase [Jannaschia sp. AI_61]GIT97026.1 biotin synthase [Jannaschia sp. AI_62]
MLDVSDRKDASLADQAEALLRSPLLTLLHRAAEVHRAHHDVEDIQKASLLSIKTGGCPEDCAYCPQSAHHKEVGLQKEHFMAPDTVVEMAARAQAAGAERFCMGAAWRRVRDGAEFEAVLDMIRGVRALGMEACVTLGMLEQHQAQALADAGLTAYNHNLDTGPEFYAEIIGTRTYRDRLETLDHVRAAGVSICCGGIIGMGESLRDRADLLAVLAGFDPQPESVPINALIPVPGTPLGHLPRIRPMEMVRMVAAARILMPKARVRLSAGRDGFSVSDQILCFMAGANSIFYGDVLLTAPNSGLSLDDALFETLAAVEEGATP